MDIDIKNLTDSVFTLPTGTVIPARGTIVVSKQLVDNIDNQLYLASINGKWIKMSEHKSKPIPTKRGHVFGLKRSELEEILEAHGWSSEVLAKVKVEDHEGVPGLRTMVINELFVSCAELGEAVAEDDL